MASPGLKLAQVFYVYGQFVPTKTSVYLRVVLADPGDYFSLGATDVVFDATNFSSITQSSYALIYGDTAAGFTGNGYLYVGSIGATETGAGSFGEASYPIKASASDSYRVWIRGRSTTGTFTALSYLDGTFFNTVTQAVGADWTWFEQTLTLSDTTEHTLGIRLQEAGSMMDKIVITSTVAAPIGEGPSYTASPFITLHSMLYTADGSGQPVSPLYIYDSKSSTRELKVDDWYNLDLHFLSAAGAVDFDGTYAIVLTATGTRDANYLVWELTENTDPYICGPSAIKIG